MINTPFMSINRILLFISIVLLFIMLGLSGGVGAQTPDPDEQDDISPETIILQVHVQEDGSAVWRIEHRYLLSDETEDEAFADLQDDIAEEEAAYIEQFTDRMEPTVSDAAELTGRSMELDNVSMETETRTLPQLYGIISYEFTWYGFAASKDDTVLVGDALAGLFLDDQTQLLVSWSEDMEATSVDPEPDESDDQKVIWVGPAEFGQNEPRVILEPVSGYFAETRGPILGMGWYSTLGLLLGIGIAIGVGGWWVIRNREDSPVSSDSIPSSEPVGSAEQDPSLLSNEEQVLQLLYDRGGRMKQQEVVQTLDWTDAKTSQVVRTLREEGEIESFRLGRENVLRLVDPDEDAGKDE